MGTRKEISEDMAMMRGVGFKMNSESAEFVHQPDSGSMIGGRRGRDEYGIDERLVEDATGNSDTRPLEGSSRHSGSPSVMEAISTISIEELDAQKEPPEALQRDFPGISEFSARSTGSVDDLDFDSPAAAEAVNSESIRQLIAQRFHDAPMLSDAKLGIQVTDGRVYLEGAVSSHSRKMLAREIAEAVSGMPAIDDYVVVSAQK